MNKFILIFLLGVTSFSCETKKMSKFEVVDSFLREEFKFEELNYFDYLVVINELGTCMNCNNSFSKSMAKNVKNKSVLFLICTPGTNVDISDYITDEKDNVLLDYHNKFGELNLVNHCAIIELGNEKIDTIIQIDINNVQKEVNNIYAYPLVSPR